MNCKLNRNELVCGRMRMRGECWGGPRQSMLFATNLVQLEEGEVGDQVISVVGKLLIQVILEQVAVYSTTNRSVMHARESQG